MVGVRRAPRRRGRRRPSRVVACQVVEVGGGGGGVGLPGGGRRRRRRRGCRVVRIRGGHVVRPVEESVLVRGEAPGAVGTGARATGRRRPLRHRRRVHVHPGVLLLPLGAPILEPDFHLCLRQTQTQGEVQPFAHTQVPGGLELVLEGDELLVGEGGARPPRLAASTAASTATATAAAPTATRRRLLVAAARRRGARRRRLLLPGAAGEAGVARHVVALVTAIVQVLRVRQEILPCTGTFNKYRTHAQRAQLNLTL